MNKLLEFQKRVEAIKKDAINPFFKSNYFDINTLLSEIKPLLNELGLILNQPFKLDDGKNVLVTSLTDSETGEVILTSAILLPELSDPQKLGSAITYLRRYSIQSLLCLQAEDDDGNTASKPSKSIDEKKKEIVRLCKELGYKDQDYKMFIFGTIGEVLEEKNFDNIIDQLTKLNKI